MRMQVASLKLAHCLMILFISSVLASTASAQIDVYGPNSKPFGKTYGEWSAEWWQWAVSIPTGDNPVADTTGGSCVVGQRGPVWFLAGSFGGTVTRSCTIPQNTALFFPVLNSFCDNVGVDPPMTADQLRQCASYGFDTAIVSVEVDGQSIGNLNDFQFASPLFSHSVPKKNILGYPAGTTFPAAGYGYYLMLQPLSVGAHTVRIRGTLPAFNNFSLDVTYNLNIVPLTLP